MTSFSLLGQLVLSFGRVGLGAFGGGLSSIPLIEFELVTRTGWMTHEQFMEVLALAQVTPGPIALNAATFVGYQTAGFVGSLVATLALVTVPLMLLTSVMMILHRCSAETSSRFVASLRPLVAALYLLALLSPLKGTWSNGGLAVGLFGLGIGLLQAVPFFRRNPPVLLFSFGLVGAFLLR